MGAYDDLPSILDPQFSVPPDVPPPPSAQQSAGGDPYGDLPTLGGEAPAPMPAPVTPYSDLPQVPGYSGYGEPSMLDQLKSGFLKGPISGIKNFFGSSAQGLGALQANPPAMPTERMLRARQSGELDQIQRAGEVAQSEQRLPTPTKEQPLYKAGTALNDVGQEALRPKKGTEFAFDIGSGAGSLLAGIGTSLVNPTAAGLMFVTGGMGESAERAVKAGATPEQIGRATRYGTAAGATDVIDGYLPFVGTPGKLAGLISKVGSKILIGALAEGGQEGAQQLIQNLIAKGVYKPDQDIKEGVGYNALIGAIVGGAAKPILDRAEAHGGQELPTEEEIRKVFGTTLPPESPPPAAPFDPTNPPLKSDQGQPPLPGTTEIQGYVSEKGAQPADAAPPGAPTDVSSRIRTYSPPVQVQQEQGDPSTVSDEDAMARLQTWVGDPSKRLMGLTINQNTIDRKAAMLPQWIAKAKQEIANERKVVVPFPGAPAPAAPSVPTFDPTPSVVESGTEAAPSPTASRSTFKLDVRGAAETTPGATAAPEAQRPDEIPSNIIDFLSARAAKEAPKQKQPQGPAPTDPNAPLKEDVEIQAHSDVNLDRLVPMLGPALYGDITELPRITIKEMFQNSYDAIKGLIQKGRLSDGRIAINTNERERTVTIVDNGAGMTPEILATKFLEIAGTSKEETEDASGGFGIAKMAFLFGNQTIDVRTMRDGKVAHMVTTGPQLFQSMKNPSKGPKITVRDATAAEKELFPEGHGTAIQVVIPKSFKDSAGNVKEITFPWGVGDLQTLKYSPLLYPIEVSYNGTTLDGSYDGNPAIGKHFPADKFDQFADMKFDWGTVHVYVTKENVKPGWEGNAHVLSNGIWQFSTELKQNPLDAGSPPIQREFYFNVSPTVKPEEGGYPFQLNRRGFTETAQQDFGAIAHYISKTYEHDDFLEESSSFNKIFYLQRNPETGQSERVYTTFEKDKPQTASALEGLQKSGNTIVISKGKIVANGRAVPILTPDMLRTSFPKAGELIVDQSKITPNRPIVNDNTIVTVSDLEEKSVIELGEQKFGARFDDFLLSVGDMFIALRDVVSDMTMPTEDKGNSALAKMNKLLGLPNIMTRDYKPLKKYGVGISFDPTYRGVHISVPYTAVFINPALPEYNDPQRAASGLVGTMIHELGHFKIKSENGLTPEFQRILIHLQTHPTFNFQEFIRQMENVITANQDVFEYINSLYTGAYSIRSRGRSFTGLSTLEAADGSVPQSGAQTFGGGQIRSEISGGPTSGERSAAASPNTQRPGLRATEERIINPFAQTSADTRALRSSSGDSEVKAAPEQEEIGPLYQAVQQIFQKSGGGPIPPAVQALPAHAAKMNRMYQYFFGVDRLVDRNLFLEPLVRYNETKDLMRGDVNKILDQAQRLAKQWRGLGAQMENLAALIDDVTNMTFRTPAEVQQGVARHPTAQEFAALVAKHKVEKNAIDVFSKVRDFFHGFLDISMQNAAERAKRNLAQDPVRLNKKLDKIVAEYDALKARPYFPFMRFGRHFVQVKDSQGHIVAFNTYERRGLRSAENVQMAEKAKIEKSLPPGFTAYHGTLPETAVPFIGLPAELLEGIEEELGLTNNQREAMKQLRAQLSPATRFAHRFQNSQYTPGYSSDFLRSFSRFAFHGARYYGKTKYKWALEKAINDTISQGMVSNDNKIGAIASYMRDHLDNTIMDTSGDFGMLKGGIFLWTFGYSVAGATLNLSQVPMVSYPFMAAKFGGIGLGDVRAGKALMKAGVDIRNYYKRGAYTNNPNSTFLQKAFEYAISTGRITESQASELASLSKAETLLGLGNHKVARGFQQFMEYGTSFFEFAEQYNRRLTYRAGLDLAQKHPGSKAEQEAVAKHSEELATLISKGMNPADAKAIITAIYTVEQTQFTYAKENRPRIMRGKLAGTIFVFKTYLLNMLQLLGANKSSMLPRFLILMLGAGGIMGLPGADDAEDIANILGKWRFGKDFKLQHELRKMLIDMGAGDTADVALHGLARRGFGIPALLDLIGEAFTGKKGRGLGAGPGQSVPAPVLDRSKAIGMGRLLPFELGKLVDPGKDVDKTIGEQAQKASGAVFSVGFNLYKALQDVSSGADPADYKTWEKAMPRAVSSITRAWRAYTEGRERGRGGVNSGATIVPYDVRDTEQMGEIIAMGLGYMPLRQAAKWDLVMADAEVKAKLKFEQEIVMRQRFEAQMGRNPQEIAQANQAIQDYNNGLPEWARGYKISADSAYRSMEQRQMEKIHREAGVPKQLRDVPVSRHLQELFPESVVDVRKVR